jgi:hypothetical protein
MEKLIKYLENKEICYYNKKSDIIIINSLIKYEIKSIWFKFHLNMYNFDFVNKKWFVTRSINFNNIVNLINYLENYLMNNGTEVE